MRAGFLLTIAALLAAPAAAQPPAPPSQAAFPGAVGWAAETPGGRGGRILRVTTLAADGPGSLKAALEAEGPRIVVFEVGGIIDLGRSVISVRNPYLTIAGQTAPSPGITIVRGALTVRTHDVIVRHLRIRAGADGQDRTSGWEPDSLAAHGAANLIVDHCTLTWGVDENLSASGPRFAGEGVDGWRRGTSHRVTFSNNIIAEGLSESSHSKGEHSKGSLIHDNASGILVYRNLYAHNMERNPLLKGGVHAAVVNNFIYDPGRRVVHYNLLANEWAGQPYQLGELSLVGNAVRGGASTTPGIAFLTFRGDGDVRVHMADNLAVDRAGAAMPMVARDRVPTARLIEAPRPLVWPEGLSVLPAAEVEAAVLAQAGARPWDRDAQDRRLVDDVRAGRGRIIDDESEVGGYPTVATTRAAFVAAEWDLTTMEPRSGRYPGQGAH